MHCSSLSLVSAVAEDEPKNNDLLCRGCCCRCSSTLPAGVEYADLENLLFNRLVLPRLMEVNSASSSSAIAALGVVVVAAGCSNSMMVGRPYQVMSGAETTGREYKCGRSPSLLSC